MTCKSIITIGRQYGSGGHEIGQKLAKELGIKCYDKELLDRAAKESGICQELFEHHDERPTNSFLYSLVMDTYSMNGAASGYTEMPLNYKVFLAQFNAIKQIAKEGPCVMIGRCADYALADFDNCISIFVHADMDKRIKRIASKYALTEAKARDQILKTDKKRASYYNYYSDKKWGDGSSYNMCIDSGVCGIDGTVQLIKDFVALKEKIKGTIKEFTELHSELDPSKQTTISSAFQYLDYTLKQKILTLYNENTDAIDAVISKWSLPQITYTNISSFVKLRNGKTHSGTIEWGENAEIYPALLALVYACLFKHLGIPDEKIKRLIQQIF